MHPRRHVRAPIIRGRVTEADRRVLDLHTQTVDLIDHTHLHDEVVHRAAGVIHYAGEQLLPGLTVIGGPVHDHRFAWRGYGVASRGPAAPGHIPEAGQPDRARRLHHLSTHRRLIRSGNGQVAVHLHADRPPPCVTETHPHLRCGDLLDTHRRARGRVGEPHTRRLGQRGKFGHRAGVNIDHTRRVKWHARATRIDRGGVGPL